MDIDLLCSLLIDALKKAGYNESTIFNYQGVIRRFKAFCKTKGVSKYSSEIGKMYADDVVSSITGNFSKQRYLSQGRFFRLIDSYYKTGEFDFSCTLRCRTQPSNEYYRRIYEKFCSDLKDEYDNENTRHFYEYGMYSILHYLESHGIFLQLEELTSVVLIEYLTQSKPSRQRGVLCELRKICRYLGRNDLLIALAGIHAVRYNRIIPVLDHEEQEQIKTITSDENVPLRDTAMILLGLSTGIRACDIIRLRLSDIDWVNDTIAWKQSKTGNLVCLPLIPSVGNAIARYIIEPEFPDHITMHPPAAQLRAAV